MALSSWQDYSPICYLCNGASLFSSPTGGCPPNRRDNSAVLIFNELARSAALMWYGTGQVLPLEPGYNRFVIPNYQQIERAKFGYEVENPRAAIYWCTPWSMLELGGRYRIREKPGCIAIEPVDC